MNVPPVRTPRPPTGPWVSVAMAVVLATTTLAPAAGVRAQATDTDAAATGAARDLYRSAMRAAEQDRWEDARRDFERSYELAPRGATLLNLAVAQVQTGHLAAAVECYRRYLARATPEERAENGLRVEQQIATLESRLARVSLSAVGLEEGDEVALDGTAISAAVMGLDLPLDPGDHEAVITRAGRPCATRAFSVVEGARLDVELTLHCPVVEPVDADLPPPVPDDPTPWIIVGIGGGAALVAGIVAAVLVATAPAPLGPYVGNVPPGMFVVP